MLIGNLETRKPLPEAVVFPASEADLKLHNVLPVLALAVQLPSMTDDTVSRLFSPVAIVTARQLLSRRPDLLIFCNLARWYALIGAVIQY